MPDDDPLATSHPQQPKSAVDEDEPEHLGRGAATIPELLPAGEPLRSLMHRLGQVEQAIGSALVVVILVLVLVQVAQRYLPGGWAWTGEIARFAMVWVTFVMSGYLMAHDGHIAIKVVDYFLPARTLGAVRLFGHCLIAVTCLAMAYGTYDFMTHDRGQVTAAAEVPLALIYIVVALGFVSTALRAALAVVVIDLPEIRRGEKVVA